MNRYEVIIIGQGPAGLSAAIYTARAGVNTLVIGCDPKVAGDYEIDNYFGFPEPVTGRALIERGAAQARRFGAVMTCEKVLAVHNGDGSYRVATEKGEYGCCGLILATGVARNRPAIKDIGVFEGRGVSYCVSCDGFFYKGKKVMVIGEGIFAANQAVELLSYTTDVRVCTDGKEPAMTPEFSGRLRDAGIPVLTKKIERLEGEGRLTGAVFDNGEHVDLDGIFLAMGDASSVDFARSLGVITSGIFIQADEEQKTNAPGIFAAGDCTGGFLQISVAVGEGAKAGRAAIEHVKSVCRAAPAP